MPQQTWHLSTTSHACETKPQFKFELLTDITFQTIELAMRNGVHVSMWSSSNIVRKVLTMFDLYSILLVNNYPVCILRVIEFLTVLKEWYIYLILVLVYEDSRFLRSMHVSYGAAPMRSSFHCRTHRCMNMPHVVRDWFKELFHKIIFHSEWIDFSL